MKHSEEQKQAKAMKRKVNLKEEVKLTGIGKGIVRMGAEVIGIHCIRVSNCQRKDSLEVYFIQRASKSLINYMMLAN